MTAAGAPVDPELQIKAAVYNYLKTIKWGYKAAKALKKEDKTLESINVDWNLANLMQRIENQLATEEKAEAAAAEAAAGAELKKKPHKNPPASAQAECLGDKEKKNKKSKSHKSSKSSRTTNEESGETPREARAGSSSLPLPDASEFIDASTAFPAGPLQRLNPEQIKTRILDNSYEAKRGDAFAAKAAGELEKRQGKHFTKEKNKKKKCSWRGQGEIDTGVNSVFFPDSD